MLFGFNSHALSVFLTRFQLSFKRGGDFGDASRDVEANATATAAIVNSK
jgi:hypothetical protein